MGGMRTWVALVLCAACGVPGARAATKTWNGGGGHSVSWTNASNWGGSLPDFDNSDNTVDDIVFGTITNGSATTLDGDKTINSLAFSTGASINYSINGDTLTIKSGTITRNTTAATSTQTVNSAIVLGNNATFTANGNHSTDSRLYVDGPISDGGNGFNLTLAGTRVLRLGGSSSCTGTVTAAGAGTYYLNGGSAATSVVNNAATLYVNGSHTNARQLAMNAGTTYVASQAALPSATLKFGGGSLGLSTALASVTFTNPIAVAGNISFAGVGSITLTSDIAMNADRTLSIGTSRYDIEQELSGAISDGIGGPHRLTITGTRVFRLSGANTYTGGTFINGVNNSSYPVWLDGSMARGSIVIGPSAIVRGNCQITFRNGDMLSVTGTLNAASMKFDLTSLGNDSQTIVDYQNAVSFTKRSPLSSFLTAASVAQQWTLTDTGTSIVANRPVFPGTIMMIQ